MIIRGAPADNPRNTNIDARKELYRLLSRPGVKVTIEDVKQPIPRVQIQA